MLLPTYTLIMALLTVEEKYRVKIPMSLRKRMGISVGDLLKVEVKDQKMIMTPRSSLEQAIAEGIEDIEKGRVSPAFSSAKEAIRYLHRQAKKLKTRK